MPGTTSGTVTDVTGTGEELYADLGDDLRRLLAEPPVTEKKLLELDIAWPGLSVAQAQVAEHLRVFLITWDPLERLATRPEGFATVNADPAGWELVAYVPVWSLVEAAQAQHTTVSAVLAAMAGSAVVTAANAATTTTPSRNGRRKGRASEPDDLLGDRAAGAALGTPTIGLVSPDWEDLGLGAITDIAKHAFGPVDLDRSPVELAPPARRFVACPACAGRRFGFPADLAEARARMCPAHDAEAETVMRTRLARANVSNPDGWNAIVDASTRLSRPHLPNGLATKLSAVSEPADLATRARFAIDAAGWFPGRATDFAVALGEEPDLAGSLPDWLVNLVLDLGRAGLAAEAAAVGDALATVDPELRRMLDGELAVALAKAGLTDQARSKIAESLTRWPNDVSIRVHAGDALLILGDREEAAAHFRAAADLAEATADPKAQSDANDRLRRLEHLERPERQGSKPEPGARPTNHNNNSSRTRPRRKRGR